MDDVKRVRVRQGSCDVGDDASGEREGRRTPVQSEKTGEKGEESRSVDVLEDQEVLALELAHLEDADDVRMLERHRDAGLALEQVQEVLALREVREHALDDDTLSGRIAGEPHFGHTARPELSIELVLSELH